MLYPTHTLPIKSLGLGVLLVGLAQTPVTSFTIDLFNEFNEGTSQTAYFNGNPIGSGTADGQLTAINENIGSGFSIINPSENTNTGLTSAVGGNRHMKISGSNSSGIITFETATDEFPNTLNLTSGEVIPTATIVWNGSNDIDFLDLDVNANLNNLDLTEFGDDSIGVEILFSDLGGTMGIELYDGTNEYLYEQTIPVVGVGQESKTLYFDFQTYNTRPLPVDTTSIDYIKMTITSDEAGYDARFNLLEATVQPIPLKFSPGLGLLISGGFFGFLGFRSRNKSKQV